MDFSEYRVSDEWAWPHFMRTLHALCVPFKMSAVKLTVRMRESELTWMIYDPEKGKWLICTMIYDDHTATFSMQRRSSWEGRFLVASLPDFHRDYPAVPFSHLTMHTAMSRMNEELDNWSRFKAE